VSSSDRGDQGTHVRKNMQTVEDGCRSSVKVSSKWGQSGALASEKLEEIGGAVIVRWWISVRLRHELVEKEKKKKKKKKEGF
jgi:hypothetical protein